MISNQSTSSHQQRTIRCSDAVRKRCLIWLLVFQIPQCSTSFQPFSSLQQSKISCVSLQNSRYRCCQQYGRRIDSIAAQTVLKMSSPNSIEDREVISSSRTWTQRKAVVNRENIVQQRTTPPPQDEKQMYQQQRPQQPEPRPVQQKQGQQQQRDNRSPILRSLPISIPQKQQSQEQQEARRRKLRNQVQERRYRTILNEKKLYDSQSNDRKNGDDNTTSNSQDQEPKQKKRRRRREKMSPMPVRGYDSSAIEDYYDLRPLVVGWRLNSLGLPLLGWYHSLLIDKALKRDSDVEIQRRRGRQLRDLLINSRSVALIKSGQALSLRPDLILNPYWAEELGKLVDAVGAFSDVDAMKIMKIELADLKPGIENSRSSWKDLANQRAKENRSQKLSVLQKMVESDPVLSLFEFYNENKVVASASIGQVYKARIRPGPQLEAAIGTREADKWGGKTVAIKVQRPDVVGSASLDMYLIRRTTTWLSKVRGGNLPKIADAFGMQLFGELDYIREANNCERFRKLYGNDVWDHGVVVPAACTSLTRQRVLVLEWIEGEKGPWSGDSALEMVSIGLRCSVDQLMNTGLFHADPHRGNLLKTPDNKLGMIDFGSVVDIDEEFRYSLFGLVIGLQNKDLPLVTENLLKLGFLKDTSQLDKVIPRLAKALKNATGGTGKASDVNFARLQAEIDTISRENVLKFSTPPFFTIILRSLTILEGVAQSVDKNFRLVRGAYPYVLRQLLSGEDGERQPKALQKLLIRLLTVDGRGEEIKWETLRDFLRLAQKATNRYNPADKEEEDANADKAAISRKTLERFAQFLTSGTGIFLKKPLIHELAETIDGMASIGEGMLIKASRGFLPALPGMNGPVNKRRMDEMSALMETFQGALVARENASGSSSSKVGSSPTTPQDRMARIQAMIELLRELSQYVRDSRLREEYGPLIEEVQSVIQLVALEVLEIRGSRAMRTILRLETN